MKYLKNAVFVITIITMLLFIMSGCGNTAQTKASASPNPTPSSNETASPASSPNQEAALPSAPQGYEEGNAMPDFSVSTIDNGSFKLSEHSGKIVFINLFATCCGPCMNEMPDIQKLYQAYGDKIDFIVIDVGGDDIKADTAFAKKNNYTFPIGNSPDGSFGSYEVQFIPQTFILDSDGKIASYFSGASSYEAFSAAIDKLLNK
jgi:peroxiredoxin